MLRVLAVGVAVVVASPAPVSLAALNPAAKESQPTVYVLGDSLHDPDLGPRSTHPYLAKRLAKLGLTYEVHAKGEQGIAWGLDQVRLHPPARSWSSRSARTTCMIRRPSDRRTRS